jgi:hypothetical protein
MKSRSFWKPKVKKIARYFLYRDTYVNFFPSLFRILRFDKEPIVICGAPRSGTTLLLSILDAHPEIFCIPFETMLLCRRLLCRRPAERRLFRNEALHALFTKFQISLYLLSQKIPATARRWCEKTPSNVYNIDFILKAYKNKVKIIHIYRDGRDVVMSVHGRVSRTIVTPDTWAKCIKAGLRYRNHENVYHLRYEDLVTDLRKEAGNLMKFLDIDYAETIEKFNEVSHINENKSLVDGHGYQGSFKLRPIDRESVGKWEKTDSEPVKVMMNNPECVNLLRELNYL